MKKKGINQIVLKTLLWTIGAWTASMLAGGFLALAAAKQWIDIQTARRLVFLLCMIILFATTLLAVRKLPRSRMPAALGMSVLYTSLSMCVGLMGKSGEVSWRALVPVAVAAVAGLLAAKKKRYRR